VIDGDTVKVYLGGAVRKRYTVRLLGIDTPESRKPGVAVECGAKEATSAMFNLGFTAPQDTDGDGLFNRKGGTGVRVDVTTDRSQQLKDRFGRLLVYVDVPSNARGQGIARYDLSRTQIDAGWSKTYTFRRRVRRYHRYRSAEGAARVAGRGVWGSCGGDFHSEQ
jgi:micrococcal nuclease